MRAISYIYLSKSPGKAAGSSKSVVRAECANPKDVALDTVAQKLTTLFRSGRTSVPLTVFCECTPQPPQIAACRPFKLKLDTTLNWSIECLTYCPIYLVVLCPNKLATFPTGVPETNK